MNKPGKKMLKTYKSAVLAFFLVVIGFAIYDMIAFEPSVPEFYSLGIKRDSVIAQFEKHGFYFYNADPVYEQPLMIGLSNDKDATIHLIGPEEDLVNIKIAIRLSKEFDKSKLNTLREYLEDMVDVAFPEWANGKSWLADQAAGFRGSGKRSKILDDKKITLRLSEKYMTAGLAFGDWDYIPKYNKSEKNWESYKQGVP